MKSILTLLVIASLFSCGNSEEKISQTTNKQEDLRTLPSKSGNPAIEEEYHNETEIIYDTIRATRSGIVEWIAGRKKIKKGQTLYGYENSEAFYSIDEKKKQLNLLMDSLIQTATGDLKFVKEKWQIFHSSLRSDTLLPNFPKIQYKEEGIHFGSENVTQLYIEIAKQEGKMKSNFVTAKASYSNVVWKIKAGKKMKKGEIIAIGARSDLFIVNVH